MEAALLPGTGAVEQGRRWASIAAAVAQPFVEAGRGTERAAIQLAARHPASWRSAARIARRARCCLTVVRAERFPPSTCASVQLPAAVVCGRPGRMIRATERANRSPAPGVGRQRGLLARVRPAAE
jgi:hypothetical protein